MSLPTHAPNKDSLLSPCLQGQGAYAREAKTLSLTRIMPRAGNTFQGTIPTIFHIAACFPSMRQICLSRDAAFRPVMTLMPQCVAWGSVRRLYTCLQ
jgi:hypothetical protein